MHKLIEYICDELEELERKADKDGKLSMAEIQYMDTLAHAKKNLLKADEMMENSKEYGSYGQGMNSNRSYGDRSMARGRGRNANRDSMGRYSSSYNSYANEMNDMVESIYNIMDQLPESTKHDAQRFVKKLEQTM